MLRMTEISLKRVPSPRQSTGLNLRGKEHEEMIMLHHRALRERSMVTLWSV